MSRELLPRITTQSVLKTGNNIPHDPAHLVVLSDSPDFTKAASNFLQAIGFITISIVEYTSTKNLEDAIKSINIGPRVKAVLLYCTRAESIENTGSMAKQINTSDIVLISPGLSQPTRKTLASMGIRHLSPPLSEAKLRRYLASLLFSPNNNNEGEDKTAPKNAEDVVQRPLLEAPAETCISKEKPQNKTVNVLAVEV